MKLSTPKTERPPSTQLRKVVFGGALVIRRSPTAPRRRLRFVALTLVLTLATSAISSGQQPGSKLWQFPIREAGTLYSPALGSDGTIYVGSLKPAPSHDAILFALTPAGTEKWRMEHGFSPTGIATAVGSDGTIYAGGYGFIQAVGSDGVSGWRSGVQCPCPAHPTIGSDGVIYTSSGGNIFAFSSNGSNKWSRSIGGIPSLGKDGRLYGNGLSLNPDGSTNRIFASLGSVPTFGLNDTIYSVMETNLFSLNMDGTTNWVFHSSENITSSPSLAADQTIYLGISSNLVALTAAGVQKWAFETRGVVRSSPAISAEGTIYFGSEDKSLYAVAADGTKRWEFATADAIRSPPAIGADGTVYIVSADGNLYAIKGTVGLANSPWPKFRGNARNTGNVADSPWSLVYIPYPQWGYPSVPGVPQYFGKTGGSLTVKYGCALCSSASMLTSFGIPITPAALDARLIQAKAYSDQDGLYFENIPAAVADLAQISYFTFNSSSSLSPNDFLNNHISSRGERVILHLNKFTNSVFAGSHYILVTGKNGNDWNVFDPGWNPTNVNPQENFSTLQGHLDGFTHSNGKFYSFTVAGYRTFKLGSIGSFVARAHSPIELMVTDPNGRRVGFDPISGTNIFEIADAGYSQDGPLADAEETGPALGDPSGVKTIYIPSPVGGTYQVLTTGTGSGAYTLDIQTAGLVANGQSTNYSGTANLGVQFTNNLVVVLPPTIQTVSQATGTITFTWSATTGQVYQVQYKNSLNQTNWNNLGGTFTATNSVGTSSDVIGQTSQKFYRVVFIP